METFEPLRNQRTIVITTFRRDGTGVPTPVSIAVDDDPSRAYVRSWTTAGKAKRIRNNSRVTLAASTFRGKVTGPTIGADARLLEGSEDDAAGRWLRRKYPILHGLLVPLVHKLRHHTTCHYALTMASPG
jgi:PPOX class probable F420-dependent enzyme